MLSIKFLVLSLIDKRKGKKKKTFEVKVKNKKRNPFSMQKGGKKRESCANKTLGTMICIPNRIGSVLKCSKWVVGAK